MSPDDNGNPKLAGIPQGVPRPGLRLFNRGFVSIAAANPSAGWRRFLFSMQVLVVASLVVLTAAVGWRLFSTMSDLSDGHEPAQLSLERQQYRAFDLVVSAGALMRSIHLAEHLAEGGQGGEYGLQVQDSLRRLRLELEQLQFDEPGNARALLDRLGETEAEIQRLFNQGLSDPDARTRMALWEQAEDQVITFSQLAERLGRELGATTSARVQREKALVRQLRDTLLAYLSMFVPVVALLVMMLVRWYRNETLMQQQKHLLDEAVENMPGGFAVFDAEDRLQLCNEAFRDLYFRSCRDFVRPGRSHDELIEMFEQCTYRRADPNEREQWLRTTTQAQRNGGSFEESIGEGRVVLTTKRRLPDGRVLSTHTEITQLKRFEDQLRENQERLQLVLGATRDGIWDWRLDLGQEEFSNNWFRMIGYQSIPARYRWRDGVHPEDLAEVESAIEDHYAARSEDFHATYRYRHADGHYIWVEARGRCERSVDGRPLRFVGALTDVSERREMEQELALSRDHLEQSVRQRTLQLENAIKELESISYTISHDLRSPLRAVDGFASILLEEYGHKLDPRGHDYLQRLRRGSQQMGRLIDDLLSLTRIFSQKFSPESVDLSALAERVVMALREAEPRRDVEVHIDPRMRALGDSTMLMILLEKLIGNAWRYSAAREPARIEVGCEEVEDERVYHVRDNGVGFDMAYYDQLFGAFRKLHGNSDFEGTGIGLATVARIIRRHKGRIWARSEPDKGAVFYFTIGLRNTPVQQHPSD